MDLAKYRNLFLEEATEHLAEMSRALLALEKDPAESEAIDTLFRMAHSIKGMAGSLGYDSMTELAHVLEDRMDACRRAGRVAAGENGVGCCSAGSRASSGWWASCATRASRRPPTPALVAAASRGAPADAPPEASAGDRRTAEKRVTAASATQDSGARRRLPPSASAPRPWIASSPPWAR